MATRYWTIIDADNIGEYSYSSTESGNPAGYDSSTWITGNHVGEVYDSGTDTWSEPMVSVAELRVERDKLLASSDFTQLPDVLSSTDRATWATYRQSLRDLPDGYIPVANPDYPVRP